MLKRSKRNACTSANNVLSVVNKALNTFLQNNNNNKERSVEASNKALKMMHLMENILPFEMDSAVVC